jgi:hypothetical protein
MAGKRGHLSAADSVTGLPPFAWLTVALIVLFAVYILRFEGR